MTTTLSQTVLSPWLTPVRLVSIANIAGTYYNGSNNNGIGATLTIAATSLTIDSVAAAVGDRLLLQTQTNTNEQGIYVVKSIGSTVVLERSDDLQSREQMKAGLYLSTGAGSLRAGNFYSLVEPLPDNIGVDAIVFNSDPSGASVTFSGAASTANALPVFSDTAGNIKAATTTVTLGQNLNITGNLTTSGPIAATAGDITAGASGAARKFVSFPATAANGTLILQAVNAGGAFNTTIASGTIGQSSVITIPDPGAATSKFVLQNGNNTALSVLNLKYGATPVPQVDPASCTIIASAGGANIATLTIQVKDGSGANIARSIPFRVYSSSTADGLTLQTAASTGYAQSVGLGLSNGSIVTTQFNGVTDALGSALLSLTDTAKLNSYIVLVFANGVKISAQLTAGSYG